MKKVTILTVFNAIKKEVKQANPTLPNWAIIEITKILFNEEKQALENMGYKKLATKEQVEQFWNLYKAIKRKTTKAGELDAQKDLLNFAQSLEGLDLENFGDYAGFVHKWIKAELITNNFGRHLYVKLGSN